MIASWREIGSDAAERLRVGDLPQVGLLLLAVLVAALALGWPARPGLPNESWYAVAQTRGALVALLSIGYGMGLPLEDRRRGRGTVVGVMVVALSTLPLEMAALAASVPAVPTWWPWLLTPIAAGGQLAFGALLGAAIRRLRLVVLAPLLVPATIVGAVALDVVTGANLVNPLLATLRPAPGYLAVHAGAIAIGLWAVWRAARRGGSA